MWCKAFKASNRNCFFGESATDQPTFVLKIRLVDFWKSRANSGNEVGGGVGPLQITRITLYLLTILLSTSVGMSCQLKLIGEIVGLISCKSCIVKCPYFEDQPYS